VSVQVRLPPGCEGLTGGEQRYRARPGGTVTVTDADAARIDRMPGNGTAGLVTARNRVFVGTKKGMRCPADGRLWNAWTTCCHSCGTATIPE
jgi:hypothetical protein